MKELNLLKEKYSTCSLCPLLVECRSQVVFGAGDPAKCKVVIIGEAPGKNEDEQGIPFVGRSGKILNSLLEGIGLSREDVFITNTVLCRPPENRDPKRDELANCRDRLDETIAILNPKVVITLGNFATKYMLKTKEGITKLRGQGYIIDGITIIPMLHPAVLLYHGNSPKKRAEFEADFSLVEQILSS